MTPLLVAVAVVVAAGGAVAVSARDARLATLGLLVALAGAGYVADPLPEPAALASRLAGSLLAVFLISVALRRAPARLPAHGVEAAGALAIAGVAFLAGWMMATSLGATLATGGEGPAVAATGALAEGSPVARAAVGAAFALVVLGVGPVVMGRDVLRLGLGLLLLVAASGLARSALVAGPDPQAELALAILTALAGAGVAAVASAALRITGGVGLPDRVLRSGGVRHRAPDDAHRTRPS